MLLAHHFEQLTRGFLAPLVACLTAPPPCEPSGAGAGAGPGAGAQHGGAGAGAWHGGSSNPLAQLRPFDPDELFAALARPTLIPRPSMAAVAAAAAEAAAATAGAAGAAGADAGGAGGALLLAEPSLVLRAGRRGLGPLYARFLASPHFLPWLQEVRAIAAGYTPIPPRPLVT